MNLSLRIREIYNYFKKKKKENLLIGSFLFVSGIIASSSGVIHLFNALLSDGFDISTLSGLIADITYSLLLILPSLALFSIGYMLWESHSLGWKLSIATCGAVILLAAANYLSVELTLSIGVLTGLAAMLEIRNRKKTSNKLKDSPTVTENLAKFGLRLSGIVCVSILVGMIAYTAVRASPYVSWDLFTNTNWSWANAARVLNGVSSGSMGGVLGYTIGSLLLVGFCEFIALPLGLGAAIYLAEYSSQNKLTSIVRFFIEALAGIPSVVIGLVGYAVFVVGSTHWGNSLVGGGLSLAFMILPWNIRIAEEAMKSVPTSYREASFALGATQWQTVRRVVLFAALPGIITGVLLGVGAALGETIVVAMTAGDAPSGPQVLPTVSQVFSFHTNIPTLTVFIWRAPQLLSLNTGASGSTTNIVFKMYGVALAGSFVLIVIYLAICAIAMTARNYLNKKIMGK
ncbi:MAG TPA: phosphate ABC transporter permease PstA [candidate division Zixibacteria bacterium]|nr:phosphate ABC transporter permease PstA [candidate division Zixibacteria bacterium]